ncbi:adenylate kinase family protein [Candidatus Woesearchaeota archaeon]|nr:adenylate kinase family protein [Candidatus Woesearchaeota archaeon]
MVKLPAEQGEGRPRTAVRLPAEQGEGRPRTAVRLPAERSEGRPRTVVIIAVTGTPGTGKSTIARKLSLLMGYAYLSGSELIKHAKLARGYDKKRRVSIIDPSLFTHAVLKVRGSLAKSGSDGLVVDSHLSHFLPKRHVSACVVLSCSLPSLARRLSKKGYSMPKIRENLDAEALGIILVEALEAGHKVVKFDTTNATNSGISRLASRLNRIVRT